MKTILATTYAVNPYRGSEDAMGWNYVYQAARFNRIIAVTRENNRPEIERYMRENPDPVYDNVQFLYYDLPKSLRWWKRGSRGAMLYYLLWQRGVVGFLSRQDLHYDIVHHLNFHNDWSPSYLWKLGKPFVWGPIGHHPRIPAPFLPTVTPADRLRDRATWAVKRFFWRYSRALRRTLERADHVWCMNDSVPEVLDLTGKRYHVSPSVATQDFGWEQQPRQDGFEVLFAGRLVSLKGPQLAVEAFAEFLRDNPEAPARFTLIGSGPERERLEQRIADLGLGERVRIIDWLPRADLLKRMKHASVFLFPSHEGAGMVVPEALSFGLPVVTLDNCGPGRFVAPEYGLAARGETYAETVSALADGLSGIFRHPEQRSTLRAAARTAFETTFHWDRRGETLRALYAKL